MERHDAVVVGAGHAGLAASHELAVAGVEHVVLERGRIAETWRSQRWDSFQLNTPNAVNVLPGDDGHRTLPPDEFPPATAFTARLAGYAADHRLPIRERVAVRAVAAADDGFLVDLLPAGASGGAGERVSARSVVVASGAQNVGRIPPIADELPARILQLGALEYRRASDLPEGAVLVVGCGQTGAQVTEDLLDAGRRVYLVPSKVPRCPRRHRGRDMLERLLAGGVYDVPVAALPDPAMRFAKQPLISGTGDHGHTVSLQLLAARGATLLGRIRGVDGEALELDDTVGECIRFGDTGSATFRRLADEVMVAAGLDLPPLDDDPWDAPHPHPEGVHSPDRLDLAGEGIATVVWATGVRGDFGYLPPDVLDDGGVPVHEAGVTPLPGLFLIGLPWLTRRASGIVYGIGRDAGMIAGLVGARSG
jgi:putative flavoprotein involved in K+ transport